MGEAQDVQLAKQTACDMDPESFVWFPQKCFTFLPPHKRQINHLVEECEDENAGRHGACTAEGRLPAKTRDARKPEAGAEEATLHCGED